MAAAWRVTNQNSLYRLCPTYPHKLVVPAAVPDERLSDTVRWRTKQRLPVLAWINPRSHAPLCRSSQPMVGITNAACPEDEALLMAIRAAVVQPRRAIGFASSPHLVERVPSPPPLPGLNIPAGRPVGDDTSPVLVPLGGSGGPIDLISQSPVLVPLSATDPSLMELPPDLSLDGDSGGGGGGGGGESGAGDAFEAAAIRRESMGEGWNEIIPTPSPEASPISYERRRLSHQRQHDGQQPPPAAPSTWSLQQGSGASRNSRRDPDGRGAVVEVREPQPHAGGGLAPPRRLSKSEDDLLAKIGTNGLDRGVDSEADEDERPSIVEGEAAVHDSTALATALQSELAAASPVEPPLMSTLRKTKSASSVLSAGGSGSGVSTRDRANGYSGSIGSIGSNGSNGSNGRRAEGEHSGCRLRILDARPFMNAKANAAKGGGSEVVSRLGGESRTTLDFMNIANIHVMRESFTALRDACGIAHATHCVYMQAGGGLLGGVREERSGLGAAAQTSVSTSQSEAESNFYHAVHDSRWLHHLSAVLRGATQAVLHLESGDPVLVHCR